MSSETNETPLAGVERGRWVRQDVLADLAADRYERAIETCRRHIQGAGGELFFAHSLGLALYKRGRFEEAREVLESTSARFPESARTHLVLGLVLRDLDRTEEAILAFDRATAADLDLAPAWLARGMIRARTGAAQEAEVDLGRALELDPTRLAAYEHLAAVRFACGEMERGFEALVLLAERDRARGGVLAGIAREVGRTEVLRESTSYGNRLKAVLGAMGDRLRELGARIQEAPGGALAADLLVSIQSDHRRVYNDLVGFLAGLEVGPLRLELARVDRIVENCLLVASPGVDRIVVEREFSAEIPEVVCDPKRIQEAFLNLVLNAVDALEPGGRLRITGRNLGEDEVSVRFEDDGPGIDPDLLERVFEFGFSTRPHGAGIGLWQARRLVGGHGGRVLASSEGRGAGFDVRLPVRPVLGPEADRLRVRPVLEEDLVDVQLES